MTSWEHASFLSSRISDRLQLASTLEAPAPELLSSSTTNSSGNISDQNSSTSLDKKSQYDVFIDRHISLLINPSNNTVQWDNFLRVDLPARSIQDICYIIGKCALRSIDLSTVNQSGLFRIGYSVTPTHTINSMKYNGCSGFVKENASCSGNAERYKNCLVLCSKIEGCVSVILKYDRTAPLLKDMLKDSRLNAVMHSIELDVLQYLFHPSGLNIRNLLWHGFLQPHEISDEVYYLLICILNSLLIYAAAAASEPSHSNDISQQPQIDKCRAIIQGYERDSCILGSMALDIKAKAISSCNSVAEIFTDMNTIKPIINSSMLIPQCMKNHLVEMFLVYSDPLVYQTFGHTEFLMALLPLLEQCIRLLFVLSNHAWYNKLSGSMNESLLDMINCHISADSATDVKPFSPDSKPQSGLLSVLSFTMAHHSQYFSTLDGFGQKHKHQLLLFPYLHHSTLQYNDSTCDLDNSEARLTTTKHFHNNNGESKKNDLTESPSGLESNSQFRNILVDALFPQEYSLLVDLFMSESGPNLRSKLCHDSRVIYYDVLRQLDGSGDAAHLHFGIETSACKSEIVDGSIAWDAFTQVILGLILSVISSDYDSFLSAVKASFLSTDAGSTISTSTSYSSSTSSSSSSSSLLSSSLLSPASSTLSNIIARQCFENTRNLMKKPALPAFIDLNYRSLFNVSVKLKNIFLSCFSSIMDSRANLSNRVIIVDSIPVNESMCTPDTTSSKSNQCAKLCFRQLDGSITEFQLVESFDRILNNTIINIDQASISLVEKRPSLRRMMNEIIRICNREIDFMTSIHDSNAPKSTPKFESFVEHFVNNELEGLLSVTGTLIPLSLCIIKLLEDTSKINNHILFELHAFESIISQGNIESNGIHSISNNSDDKTTESSPKSLSLPSELHTSDRRKYILLATSLNSLCLVVSQYVVLYCVNYILASKPIFRYRISGVSAITISSDLSSNCSNTARFSNFIGSNHLWFTKMQNIISLLSVSLPALVRKKDVEREAANKNIESSLKMLLDFLTSKKSFPKELG